MREIVRLKSTNEIVKVLYKFIHPKAGNMLRVSMKPQQSWHSPRVQNVREDKVKIELTNN